MDCSAARSGTVAVRTQRKLRLVAVAERESEKLVQATEYEVNMVEVGNEGDYLSSESPLPPMSRKRQRLRGQMEY